MTQAQAATYFDMTSWQYRLAERGESDAPKVTLGRIAPNEAAVILRRREGMTRTALAKKLNCSAWWLTLMERGKQDPARLVDFWTTAAK